MATSILKPSSLPITRAASRTFFTPPTSPNHLSAVRTLPYPTLAIYDIIADIAAYPSFLPLCTSAQVTSFSRPDRQHARRWPQTATLNIGLLERGITESFVSRVYCVPPGPSAPVGIVEAISGAGTTGLAAREIEHHDHAAERAQQETDAGDGPMALLRTRWTVTGYPFKSGPPDGAAPQEASVETNPTPVREMTNVHLDIEYKFKNPVYEMLGKAVSGQIAETMVAAFEARVEALLGKK